MIHSGTFEIQRLIFTFFGLKSFMLFFLDQIWPWTVTSLFLFNQRWCRILTLVLFDQSRFDAEWFLHKVHTCLSCSQSEKEHKNQLFHLVLWIKKKSLKVFRELCFLSFVVYAIDKEYRSMDTDRSKKSPPCNLFLYNRTFVARGSKLFWIQHWRSGLWSYSFNW